MIQNHLVHECPRCGGKDLGKGKQSGYAVLNPFKKILGMGSTVIYILCTDCGYIIDQYVEKPARFKGTL